MKKEVSTLALAGCTPDAPVRLVDQPPADDAMDSAALDYVSEATGGEVDALVGASHKDHLGLTHTRLPQLHDGVAVFGGEGIAHLDARARLVGFTDGFVRDLDVDTTPVLDPREAVARAELAAPVGPRTMADPTTDLQVLRDGDVDRLAWRVRFDRMDGTEHSDVRVVFVDAHTGGIVWQYDNLRTLEGSGDTNYYGTVAIETTEASGTYYLENDVYGLGTYTYNNTTDSPAYLTDDDNRWTSTAQREGVDAHYAGTKTLEYFEQVHGWHGLDGQGGPEYVGSVDGSGGVISMFVDYGQNYANAGWTGSYMIFGDGDGDQSGPLTTLDVTGHEMTHGVVENTAGLVYSGESGALDESFADVFGALAERHALGDGADRWWIGEDCTTPGVSGDAMRYMEDPTRDGMSRDHYDSRYTGAQDNGGVHINSGIGNLAFYLLANGGTHPTRGGSMDGIGVERAAEIWFRALTTYLTPRATFDDARTATRQAAADLNGEDTSEHAAVAQAWALVGVGTYTPPVTEPEPEPEPEPTGCASLDELYAGSLSGRGDSAYEPDGDYYYAPAGIHEACLEGAGGTDFDLTLYEWNGSGWRAVSSSESNTSSETIRYEAASGYFTWKVSSYSGSGSYELGLTRP